MSDPVGECMGKGIKMGREGDVEGGGRGRVGVERLQKMPWMLMKAR